MNARIAMLLVLALPLAARAEFTGKVVKIGVQIGRASCRERV